jgi:hypothetical protein
MAHESLAWLYGDPMGPDGLVAGMYDVVPAQLGTVVGRGGGYVPPIRSPAPRGPRPIISATGT